MSRKTLIRIIYVIAIVGLLSFFLAGVPVRAAQIANITQTPLPQAAFQELTPEKIRILADASISPTVYAIYQVSLDIVLVAAMVAMGTVVVWSRSDDWFALIVGLALPLFGANIVTTSLQTLTIAYPALVPLYNGLTMVTIALFVGMTYLFPNGSFTPSFTKWIYGGGMAVTAILLFMFPVVDLQTHPASNVFGPIFIIGFLSQVYRYIRVSTHTERQQTRWVLLGLFLTPLGMISWSLITTSPLPPQQELLFSVFGMPIINMLLLSIPITLTIAILRYHLWGIDIIIRRTLQYGAISAILAAVYFGTVVLLQSVFRGVVGAESPLVVVLSTLLIAALFNPVRGRVQRIVDRRFYRQRYDAEQVLAAFSSAMRDEVNLEQIEHELLATVSTTLEPEHVSLWVMKETN